MQPCAYYDKNGACAQSMTDHVRLMLKAMKEILPRYENRIKKVTGLDPEKILKTAIVLHDLGKLTRVYHDNNTGKGKIPFYRHELVSAAVSLQMLESSGHYTPDEARTISLTTLHHHEPLMFGMLGNINQPALTPSIAYNQITRLGERLSWHPSKEKVEEFLNEFSREIGELELPVLSAELVTRNLSRLVVMARYHPFYRREYYRKVVPFVIPLVLCDYKGASERGGKKPFFTRYVDRMVEAARNAKK